MLISGLAFAGPELAMREFSSGQIKKGVRAIGMGGDGATIGNYSLVFKDSSSAIADYGSTSFTDSGNRLEFAAVGFNTPSFWDGAGLFVIAMAEWGSGLKLHLSGADYVAEAADQAVFMKFAKPLGHGVSVGLLLSWEHSSLTAVNDAGSQTWTTSYLPSGGFGVAWTVNRWITTGVRALLNNDEEHLKIAEGERSGWNRNWELRWGISGYFWPGGIVDVGYVGLARGNALDDTSTYQNNIVAGLEQRVTDWLWLRGGWDEHSPTFGLSARVQRFKLDVAYVHDLGIDRSKGVFGQTDEAVLLTLNFDYGMGTGSSPATPPSRAP